MRPFLPQISNVKNFTPLDCWAFHFLPEIEYFAGVYETSQSAFAKILKVNYKTVGKFFGKLEDADLVNVLRRSTSGRYSGIAFVRKESTLHNKVYSTIGKISTLQNNNPYYIDIPKSFLKSPPKQDISIQLIKLISRQDLQFQSVHSILRDYVLTDQKGIYERQRSIIQISQSRY